MDLYTHLETNACTNELPHNCNHSFKNCLPHLIYLKEWRWKVGLASISYPVKPQKFSFNSMGRIGDFTFYSAIAAYQEFFQGEATILLWNTHLGWNELPMYCEKIWLGGGGVCWHFSQLSSLNSRRKKVIQHSNFWAASANNLKRSAKFSNGL